jgi:hypothetical protein
LQITIIPAERLLRILRLGRLLEAHRGLKMLYLVFISCAPSFANIGGLIFVVLFMWAYLGVQVGRGSTSLAAHVMRLEAEQCTASLQLFGTMQFGSSLNGHANFQTWPTAMLVMLRAATADNWWVDTEKPSSA